MPAPEQIEETAPPTVRHYAFNERRDRQDLRWDMVWSLAALHAAAFLAIGWHLLTRSLPPERVIITFVVMYVFCGFGISLGYHRYFTHRGFTAPRWLQRLMLAAGAMSLEGAAIDWVEWHWYHHERSDCPGDGHSPYQYGGTRLLAVKGVGWAHMGCHLYQRHQPAELPRKYQWIRKDDLIAWQKRRNGLLVLASLLIPTIVGAWGFSWTGALDGLFVAGFLRIVLFLHMTWSINSVCHVWGSQVTVWYRRTKDSVQRSRKPLDGSRNNPYLALPTLGEGYHGYHHLFDSVAYHGWRRFDLDPTKWLLIVLSWLRVVKNIVKPPPYFEVTAAELRLPDDSFIRQARPDLVDPELDNLAA